MYAKLRNLNILPYKKEAFETYKPCENLQKKEIKKHPPQKVPKIFSQNGGGLMVMIYHGTRQKVTEKNTIPPVAARAWRLQRNDSKRFSSFVLPFQGVFFSARAKKQISLERCTYLQVAAIKKVTQKQEAKNKKNTPWKIDMEVKNGGLEDDVPFQFGDL